MAKKQVSIKEFVKDWRMGLSEADLMEKHGLSQNQLQKVYKKLVDAGKIDPMEFEEDAPEFEATVELASACPHCGALKLVDSDLCAQCGLHSSMERSVESDEGLSDADAEVAPSTLEAHTVSLVETDLEAEALEPETEEQGETAGGDTDLGSLITFALGGESNDKQEEEDFNVEEIPEEYSDLFVAEQIEEDGQEESLEAEEVVSEPEPAPEKKSRSLGRPVLIAAGLGVILVIVAAAGLFTGLIPLPGASEPASPPVVASKPHKPWAKKIKAPERKANKKEEGGHVDKKAAPSPKVSLATPAGPPKKGNTQRKAEKKGADSTTAEEKTQPQQPQWLAKVQGRKRPIPEHLPAEKTPAEKKEPQAKAPEKVEPQKKESIPTYKSSGGPLTNAKLREHKPPETNSPDKPAAPASIAGSGGGKPLPEKVVSPAVSPEPAPVKESAPEDLPAPASGDRKTASLGSGVSSGAAPPESLRVAAVKKPEQPDIGKPQPEPGREKTDSPTAPMSKEIPAHGLKKPTLAPSEAYSSPRLALNAAVRIGDVDTARLALDRGADVNAKDRNRVTLLMDAVEGGNTNLAQLLLARGADPSPKDRSGATALDIALHQQNTEMLILLLTQNKKLASKPLIKAATAGDMGTIKLLVSSGADVNAGDRDGNTALMFAAENGRLDVIRALLAKGADVNATNSEGVSALGWAYSPSSLASLKMRKAVVRLLKQHGAQSRSADRKRR